MNISDFKVGDIIQLTGKAWNQDWIKTRLKVVNISNSDPYYPHLRSELLDPFIVIGSVIMKKGDLTNIEIYNDKGYEITILKTIQRKAHLPPWF